jgi:hypothetical protein
VKAAVEKKNKFFHDRIFRGIVLAPVPDWLNLTRQELEQRRQAGVAERMTALREYDAQIRQALERKPHRVEVVPVKK